MKERPILFSGAMVRAILDGRKSQTRRVIKDFAIKRLSNRHEFATSGPHQLSMKETPGYAYVELDSGALVGLPCPYGQPGDRLWVRETFRVIDGQSQDAIAIDYRSDPEEKWCRIGDFLGDGKKWTPSIHMRREYSRIMLEITNVRVERLQDISNKDCIEEGVADLSIPLRPGLSMWRSCYADLWDSINAARGYGWDVNPWVWVIEFRMVS